MRTNVLTAPLLRAVVPLPPTRCRAAGLPAPVEVPTGGAAWPGLHGREFQRLERLEDGAYTVLFGCAVVAVGLWLAGLAAA